MPKVYTLFFFIVLTLISCKKEEITCFYGICIDWSPYCSTATINNGMTWEAQFCTFVKQNNTGKYMIELKREREEDKYLETIGFNDLPLIKGKLEVVEKLIYQHNESPNSMFWVSFDEFGASNCYKILQGSEFENYLNITYISTDSMEIKGTYHLNFVVSDFCPPIQNPNMPDTILFRNGVFRAINMAMID